MATRGYWIALAIVLFYLIARPHVGTVWYVAVPTLALGTLPTGATPITPPPTSFADKADCQIARFQFQQAIGKADAVCVPKSALLWGW